MAKTLLNGVNDLLNRMATGDSNNALSTLTDEGKQVDIDLAIQVWNELVDDLYSVPSAPTPQIMGTSTITLVTDDRDYALANDLTRLRFPLRDETNEVFIQEYPGGYFALIDSQPNPDNFTGVPNWAAIRPSDGELYLDMKPTSAENGRVYSYEYEKDGALTDASDTFPFTDKVYRAILPAAHELMRLYQENKFTSGVFNASMGRAARLVTGVFPRRDWTPRRNFLGSERNPFAK